MISLPSPITVATGSQSFSSLDYVLQDSATKKICQVRFNGVPGSLTIWSGDTYKAVGTYTQAELDAAITSALGANPAAVIQGIFLSADAKKAGRTATALSTAAIA